MLVSRCLIAEFSEQEFVYVGDAGIVVPTKDAGALADGIEKLLLDESLRKQYAQAGRERIENRFSWRLAAQQMTALYCGVMDANR